MTSLGIEPVRERRHDNGRKSRWSRRALSVRVTAVILAFSTATCAPALAGAASSSTKSLDAATKRALELERRLEDLKAEQVALQLRLDATAQALRAQDRVVAAAQVEAERAQEALRGRAVAMYKSSDVDALALMFGASSWSDLVTRASLVTRMLETDSRALDQAEATAAQARKEADTLEKLHREELSLRNLQQQRVAAAKAALDEQKRLVATLSEAAKRLLAARKAAAAASQKKWAGSGASGGTRIPKVSVKVSPYDDITFLAADYAPKRFRATGQTFVGLASWYGAAVDGHRTASGRIFNHEDFTCAHRSLPFGTWLAVTRGDRRVIVMVTDRGPYTGGRVLDLSEAAAQALGIGGVKTVNAEVIVPQ